MPWGDVCAIYVRALKRQTAPSGKEPRGLLRCCHNGRTHRDSDVSRKLGGPAPRSSSSEGRGRGNQPRLAIELAGALNPALMARLDGLLGAPVARDGLGLALRPLLGGEPLLGHDAHGVHAYVRADPLVRDDLAALRVGPCLGLSFGATVLRARLAVVPDVPPTPPLAYALRFASALGLGASCPLGRCAVLVLPQVGDATRAGCALDGVARLLRYGCWRLHGAEFTTCIQDAGCLQAGQS